MMAPMMRPICSSGTSQRIEPLLLTHPCATRAKLFSIVSIAVVVGLSRHAHEAVGTSDETLEEVFSMRSCLKGLGSARVLLHGVLDCFEQFHGYKGFMLAFIELISMSDPAGEEWVVEDASDRCRGEHPGLCDQLSLSIG